ncbi:3-hydroxyisobutyrate dehydrogenase [Zobellella maritima]|uniref:3-hydroxyisobutyrate dehydrogenase n=1 Tax=Zobellella maritima TaxID=2059725 RepID=UPI000E3054E5|nr:3-hydroxyisobutyrate dehydrogenase [Zobellella maritima]
MSTIAFIGLGNMGGPMAANLVKAGHRVQAFDLSEAALNHALEAGCQRAASAVEAVQGAEVVISMLQTGRQVDSLYVSGDAPLFEHIDGSALVIDCSTIDAATARSTAAVAARSGLDFIDAPVSGGVAGAQAATLTFIVGGADEQFARAEPVLKLMGKNILHAGDHGAGQIAKACNNMLLAVLMAGTCEALNMGINSGLDAKVLSDIIKQSSGNNWALQLYNPVPGVMEGVPASRNYQGGFQVNLMCKDLGLAMEVSQQSGSPVPMGSAAKALFNLHQVAGNGSLDFSSVLRLFKEAE